MILQRLKEYIDFKGISVSAFEKSIGMSNASFGKCLKNDGAIGTDKLENILSVYPDLNVIWLTTGEGDMLAGQNLEPAMSEATHIIRYWHNIDGTASGVTSFDDYDEDFIPINVPGFKDCTDAVNVYGESMSPLYKNGSIVILKKWTEAFIDFGNVYLIITNSGYRMLKYIRKSASPEKVLCVSENTEFEPFEIDRADILRLYLVKGGISRESI